MLCMAIRAVFSDALQNDEKRKLDRKYIVFASFLGHLSQSIWVERRVSALRP